MKLRGRRKMQSRLDARRKDWDALPAGDKQSKKQPGSQNPHKQGAATSKKAKRR